MQSDKLDDATAEGDGKPGQRNVQTYPYFGIELFIVVHCTFAGCILADIWLLVQYRGPGQMLTENVTMLYTLVWCLVNLVRKRPHWTAHQWLFVAVMLLGWPLFYWSYFVRGTVVNFGGIPWEQAAPIFAIAYVVILVARRRITGRRVFDHDDPNPTRW